MSFQLSVYAVHLQLRRPVIKTSSIARHHYAQLAGVIFGMAAVPDFCCTAKVLCVASLRRQLGM